MKVYTCSEARRRLSEVLDMARTEEVLIKRRGGEMFSVTYRNPPTSPFDVPGVNSRATPQDILDAVRESRARAPGQEDIS